MSLVWILVTGVTLLILIIFGLKRPQGMLALYLNGLFIATLLLTNTGIPFFAGGSVLLITTLALAVHLFKEVGLKSFWQRSKGLLSLLVLLMALELVLAFVYGSRSSYGMLKIVRFLTINLFFYFGVILFAYSESHLHSFLKYTAYIGLAYSFTSVVGMLLGDPLAMYGWNNRIWFSRSLGLTLILFYYFWGTGVARRYKLLIVTGVFFLALMFLNASRGPVIALYFALLTFELFDFSGVKFSKRLGKIILLTLVFYIIFWSGSPLTKPLENAAAQNNQLINIDEKFAQDAGGTGNQRLVIWKYTLEQIKDNPVLGIGTGSFRMVSPISNETYRYPHNILLEIMVEQGLAGIVLWLLFLLYALALALQGIWYKSEQERYYLIGLVLLVYGMVNALVSGDITDNNFIFVAVGLIAAARILERRELLR